ncbi:MAG TPA: hypothetical protein VJ001_00340 [Rhodocyclaceae bacterium]|nr:hypothetical protein [Rhodocyclaceae bacterium]
MAATDWAASQSACAWERLSVRDGEKGTIVADYMTQRVWLWDGEEKKTRCWHLLARRELDGTTLKFCLSNIKPTTRLRNFVERAFEDAKGSCEMAGYQVSGWQAWHHHTLSS